MAKMVLAGNLNSFSFEMTSSVNLPFSVQVDTTVDEEEDEGINTMTPPKTPAEDYSKQQYGDQMESTTTL